ncbi:AMP-binding protein [Paenibacillus sp. IITD108]|uniref:AMP-binding protein n=1 Tax=Paenibacillus sp. IITD108 TaxID=3116649 RepID=UPI002F42867F
MNRKIESIRKQDIALRNILSHALQTVPYYQTSQIWDSPTIEDFPILERSAVAGNETSFLSTAVPFAKLKYQTTSGSTGTPIRCFKSKIDSVRMGIPLWKRRNWFGKVSPNDRYVMFTMRYNLDNPVIYSNNILFLSLLDLSPAMVSLYINEIIKFQPKWLFGPPSALHYIALHLIEKEIKGFPRLQFIELAGEFSTPEEQAFLSDVFRCQVTNMYGSKETWLIAYSCPNGHMHVADDNVFLELIPLQMENTQTSEVLITGLNNFAMPFVRYKLGDIAQSNPKLECEYPGPSIKLIGGRSGVFFSYNEKLLNSAVLFMLIIDFHQYYPGTIRQFQFEQRGPYQFVLHYIPGAKYQGDNITYLEQLIKSRLDGIDLTLNALEYIPLSNNGKVSYYVNNTI